MGDKPGFLDRAKQQPLWFWGFCCCFGGMFANLAMMMLIDSGELRRSQERATQLGALVGGGVLMLIGIGFFIAHCHRRSK